MSRSNGRRNPKPKKRGGSVSVRSVTKVGIQSANLSSPFFREVWSFGSTVTWQQFVDRWERRFGSSSRRE
jgi:hypothetical protein